MTSLGLLTRLLHSNYASKQCIRSFCLTKQAASSTKMNLFDLNFDRRIKVDPNDSIKYMESETYKSIYGDQLVWQLYKRNHRAQFASRRTRHNCINQEGFVSTSYPCPICRDEYLVLHPNNVKLIQQFIDPYTGNLVDSRYHGLCRNQLRNLIIAVHRAKDLGTLIFKTEDRYYDYSDYYGDSSLEVN